MEKRNKHNHRASTALTLSEDTWLVGYAIGHVVYIIYGYAR